MNTVKQPDSVAGRLRALHESGEIDLAEPVTSSMKDGLAERFGCHPDSIQGVLTSVRRQVGVPTRTHRRRTERRCSPAARDLRQECFDAALRFAQANPGQWGIYALELAAELAGNPHSDLRGLLNGEAQP